MRPPSMKTSLKTSSLTALSLGLALGLALPTTAQAAPAGPIPKGFPIAQGLGPWLHDADVTVQGPSRAVGKVPVLSYCDVDAFGPSRSTRRLTISLNGPEWFSERSLLGFRSAKAATQAFRKFKLATSDCRRYGMQRHRAPKARTTQPSATVTTWYADGLGSAVTQVTRQGSWLLLVTNYGEGTRESLPGMVSATTRTSNKLARKVATLAGS